MEQENLPSGTVGGQEINEETLNEIYTHEIHETSNNYWQDWKDRFEPY